jgi:hypothetical protein
MNVIWMPEAIETYAHNISYLAEEWNDDVVLDFIGKTDEVIGHIKANPLMFQSVDKRKKVHRCIVVRQVSLYYKISGDQIDLITFWNNYQDPKKLKFK